MPRVKVLFRRIVDGASIMIVLLALGVLGQTLLGHRLRGPEGTYGQVETETQEWFYRFAKTGRWLGPRDASVMVLVFSNYLCGHCVQFDETLVTLRYRYPEHVAVVFKHFVVPGASADLKIPLGLECAAQQGRFWEYLSAAFKAGRLKTYSDGWRTLAISTGVPDLPDFEQCVQGGRH